MKGTTLIFLFLLFGQLPFFAQDDFGAGLLFDDLAFKKEVEMTAEFSNDGRRAGDLPRWFSLRPYTPYPKNQGSINSCVGWAMGYAAMTTQRAYEKRITNRKEITDNAFSALYIYNQVKEGNCMAGAYVQKAAQFLAQSGDCRSSDFDFPYTDCERQPQAVHVSQSQDHLIKDFVALFDKETPAKTKVMRCKRSIAEGKPVVVGVNITESLKRVSKLDPTWAPSGSSFDKKLGGHAICVTGYNDSTGVFEMMNSWGTAWGDEGFFYLSYKDFTETTFQAVQLILPELPLSPAELEDIEKRKLAALEKQQKSLIIRHQAERSLSNQPNANTATAQVQQAQALIRQAEQTNLQTQAEVLEAALTTSALAGDFVLRIPMTDDYGSLLKENGEYLFEEVKPVWNGSFYELNKKDWMEDDMFQVIARNIKKDSYVYLFSLDGNNKAEIHWPRNQRFQEHLNAREAFGAGEGALVAHTGAEIVIPGNDRVLVRENLLEDYIVVLYAYQKITDFQARVVQMRDECKGDFTERLQQAFGDLLVPVASVNYEKEQMRTSVNNLDGKQAAAVVVKVENE